jgi:hypothetical protein
MANKQKPVAMTADEFKEYQEYLGNPKLNEELHRSPRQVDNYRAKGVTDPLVADRVLFLVAEKAARECGETCIVKGCETVSDDGSPYCKACRLEFLESGK